MVWVGKQQTGKRPEATLCVCGQPCLGGIKPPGGRPRTQAMKHEHETKSPWMGAKQLLKDLEDTSIVEAAKMRKQDRRNRRVPRADGGQPPEA